MGIAVRSLEVRGWRCCWSWSCSKEFCWSAVPRLESRLSTEAPRSAQPWQVTSVSSPSPTRGSLMRNAPTPAQRGRGALLRSTGTTWSSLTSGTTATSTARPPVRWRRRLRPRTSPSVGQLEAPHLTPPVRFPSHTMVSATLSAPRRVWASPGAPLLLITMGLTSVGRVCMGCVLRHVQEEREGAGWQRVQPGGNSVISPSSGQAGLTRAAPPGPTEGLTRGNHGAPPGGGETSLRTIYIFADWDCPEWYPPQRAG